MERISFEILSAAAENRDLSLDSRVFGWKQESLDDARIALEQDGYLSGGTVTKAGLEALEPYRVKRAVFIAAGFGSRMVPITINTPKPLVRVHGKRIIETLIDAILAAGITEIFIVRGYLGEQFELLQKKYPMIRLVDNLEYDGTGTISSFFYARELLEQAYVLESDLVVANPKIIRKYHYGSDFMGIPMKETDDWFLKTDAEGTIQEIGVNGAGDNLFRLIGISYWDKDAGHRLAHDIKEAYDCPDGKMLPMSYVPFRVYRDRYQVSVMPCQETDVIEIDSFRELQEMDKSYQIKG